MSTPPPKIKLSICHLPILHTNLLISVSKTLENRILKTFLDECKKNDISSSFRFPVTTVRF